MPLSPTPNAPHGALPSSGVPNGSIPPGSAPNDPLAALRDIHLPAPVEWWPLAPGWWLLIALGVASLIAVAIYLYRHIKRNAYRHQALLQLQQLAGPGERNSLWLQSLNELLKRCAHSAYPQGHTSSLHGKTWCNFLQQQVDNAVVTPEALALLSDGGYKSDSHVSAALTTHANDLLDFSKQWISQHHRAIKQPAVDTVC